MCVIVSNEFKWILLSESVENKWTPRFFFVNKKKKNLKMDIESDESERWEDFFGKFYCY